MMRRLDRDVSRGTPSGNRCHIRSGTDSRQGLCGCLFRAPQSLIQQVAKVGLDHIELALGYRDGLGKIVDYANPMGLLARIGPVVRVEKE